MRIYSQVNKVLIKFFNLITCGDQAIVIFYIHRLPKCVVLLYHYGLKWKYVPIHVLQRAPYNLWSALVALEIIKCCKSGQDLLRLVHQFQFYFFMSPWRIRSDTKYQSNHDKHLLTLKMVDVMRSNCMDMPQQQKRDRKINSNPFVKQTF